MNGSARRRGAACKNVYNQRGTSRPDYGGQRLTLDSRCKYNRFSAFLVCYPQLLPPRSMAGQTPLERHIGVRVPGGQPKSCKLILNHTITLLKLLAELRQLLL